jgi:SNF2 family DNA or RNA helicase
MALELRDYQVEGVRFLSTRRSAILADEMGVGKTIQALEAWHKRGCQGPTLLIARPNAQAAWIAQCNKWGFDPPVIISGTQKQRREQWAEVDQYSFAACTIEALQRDLENKIAPRRWHQVFCDEIHSLGLLNRKGKHFKVIKTSLNYDRITLITGSPLRRGFQDLWGPLHLCNPKQFSSYWRYLSTFGYMMKNEYGAWEILGLKERDKLLEVIAPYYIRREKADVASELPPKTRVYGDECKLEMTSSQSKLYNQLTNDLLAELSTGELLITPTVLSLITRLRQVLCCPKILDDGADWGASLEHLGELIDDTDDLHFVIFTPFTKAMPHIYRYLQQKFGLSSLYLRGGYRPEDVNIEIEAFRRDRCPIVCSIDFSQAFDLTPAAWAYFLAFSWSPEANMQAEDRLHRLTTTSPVTYYYPTHKGCIDEELVLEANTAKAAELLKLYRANPDILRNLLTRSQKT